MFLFFAGCILQIDLHESTESFQADGVIRSVLVYADNADIRVEVSDDGTTRGDVLLGWHHAPPDVSWSQVGDVLSVHVDCDPGDICEAELDLHVPTGTAFSVDSGAGDISVAGGLGDLDLDTGAGDITLRGIAGTVLASAGAGDIVATNLATRRVDVETGAGDVDLAFSIAPDDVEMRAGAGDLDLLVPAGHYAVEAETGAGDVVVTGISDDPSAPRSLTLWTGAGDIAVRGYFDPDLAG